jgi:hypothetical protein
MRHLNVRRIGKLLDVVGSHRRDSIFFASTLEALKHRSEQTYSLPSRGCAPTVQFIERSKGWAKSVGS